MYQKKTQKWLLSITIAALFLSFSISCFAFEKEIKSMASVLAENILKAGRKTIAVVDFNDLQGNVTELGRFFAEEFSVALASAGKEFEVVDRTNLKTILIEHKLSTTGIIDPQTARKLGQIAGVDALITGTITPFGDTVRVTVKILDTNTARVIGASSGDIAKTKAIEELLGKGIGENTQASNTKNISTGSEIKPAVIKPIFKVESNGFVFDLLSCRLSSTTIICDFKITNLGKDHEFQMAADSRTRIIDENGTEVPCSYGQIGRSEGSGWISTLLATDIPIKARVKFDKIDPAINQISLLEIFCAPSYPSFSVQFRNVPITK